MRRERFVYAPPPPTPLNATTKVFAPKIVEPDLGPPPIAVRWEFKHALRPWQGDALAAWEAAGRRGVVEAATGTGKTAVALAAAERLRRDHGVSLRVVVVVPTIALATQWRDAMAEELGVPASLVGEVHSGGGADFGSHSHVMVTVINSARNRLQEQVASWRRVGQQVLVVVDECHRAGSEHNARVVETDATATLGLSATPERSDQGHSSVVYPGIGEPVYRYPVLTALEDGVLAPLKNINLYVDFTPSESADWDQRRRELGQALAVLESRNPGITRDPGRMWKLIAELAREEDPDAMRVVALLARRSELLAGAENRHRCLDAALKWLASNDDRAIVFHERVRRAEMTMEILGSQHVPATLDHSGLKQQDRSIGLDRFRRGLARVLVAVRSLDEGIDVPDASIAVIASGSRSPRQRIQRLGRILRRSGDKEATCISILVRGTADESYVGARDAELVGASRVVHHRWPGRSLTDALTQPSSYKPVRAKEDEVERLTAVDMVGVSAVRTARAEGSLGVVRPSPKLSGGYVAAAAEFSPNAWHKVAEVRNSVGMPVEMFDHFRPGVRRLYRSSLDPERLTDATLIHGTEIEAIRRMWKTHRQSGRK